jgi:hypothetical protein
VVFDNTKQTFYKIPVGAHFNSKYIYKMQNMHICINTLYTTVQLPFNLSNIKHFNNLQNKLKYYKPIYFDRFKYVGKGFKLIFKKKKNMFNCIFGHSHIFWVKLQTTFIKKTKKYKYLFISQNKNVYTKTLAILKKIKPINRYTLRGVRTYSSIWTKRKGRKSIATHI